MFRSLLLLVAALLSTGVHWDMTQLGAWARMTAMYAEGMPVRQAVQLALNPDNACGLCQVVAGARDAEEQVPPLLIERQVDKQVCEARVPLMLRPRPAAPSGRPDRFDARLRAGSAPPVPPPRLG
ncbi:MAG: hypothetical protein ACFE0O_04605 [Opitutales bacterium]